MEFLIENDDLLNPDSRYLQKYAGNITSQCGEDGIIAEIFRRIDCISKVCVDVGASDGVEYSNIWNLIKNEGWKGVLIEGSNVRFQQLESCYEGDDRTILVYSVVQSTETTIDSIIDRCGVVTDIDFMSIDIDGIDWHVWKSLEKYRPRVICIEFNPSIPNSVYYVQDDDLMVQQGASLRAMIRLGKDKGYELAATTELNAIFVCSEDFPALGIKDNSIHAMHTPGSYEAVQFQFYDGTKGSGGRIDPIWSRA